MDEEEGKDGRGGGEGRTRGKRRMNEGEKGLRAREVTGEG